MPPAPSPLRGSARGGRGLPRAPFGRPGLRIARSYGANIGGPEGRGCLAPGAVPARRAGTSPGSAAVPARQAPPGAPGILEGAVGRPVRFGANSLTHGARAILMENVVIRRLRQKTGARHECKIAYSWRAAERCRASMPDLRTTHSGRLELPRQAGTAANNAAVAPGTMRFRANSLTHGARAFSMEGVVMQAIRRKMGRRHECKISDSWPALSDVEGRARQPSHVFEQPVRVVRGPKTTKRDASSFASFAAENDTDDPAAGRPAGRTNAGVGRTPTGNKEPHR